MRQKHQFTLHGQKYWPHLLTHCHRYVKVKHLAMQSLRRDSWFEMAEQLDVTWFFLRQLFLYT